MAREISFRISIQGTDKQVQELGQLRESLLRIGDARKALEKQAKTAAGLNRSQSKELGDLIQKEKELRGQTQKLNNSIKASASQYSKLVNVTREAKNRAKELAVQYGTTSKEFLNAANRAAKLDVQLKKIDRAVGDNFRNVGNYQGALKSTVGTIGQLATGIGGAVLAFSQVKRVIGSSIEAFGEQERVEKQLEVALGRTSQALLDQASALQRQTKFGDEAIIQSQALLAQFGLQEDEIMKLTPALLDFAEAQGIGLEDAAKLLSKSLGSSTNALSRYGIEIKGAVGSQERLDSAVTSLNEKFEGQAKAAALVGTGPLIQLQNQIGDLQEKMGGLIIQGITPVAEELSATADTIDELSEAFGGLGGDADEASEKFSLFGSIFDALTAQVRFLVKAVRLSFEPFIFLANKFNELTGAVSDSRKEMRGAAADINETRDSVTKLDGAFGDLVDRLKNADLSGGLIANLQKDISKLQEEITNATTEAQIIALNERLKIKEEELKRLRNLRARERSEEISELESRFINLEKMWKEHGERLHKQRTKQRELQEIELEKIELSFTEQRDIKLAEQAIANRKLLQDELIKLAGDLSKALFENAQEKNERDTELQLAQLEIESENRQTAIQDDADTENQVLKSKLDNQLITEQQFEQQKEDIDKNKRAQQLKAEQQQLAQQRAIEKEQFERTKRLQTQQAIISGALSVLAVLSAPPASDLISDSVIRAIRVGATVAATGIQIATIQGAKFAKGGVVSGAGTGTSDSIPARLSNGESVINARSTEMFRGLLSDINVAGGGRAFARGGVVTTPVSTSRNVAKETAALLNSIRVENVATETARVNGEVMDVENLLSA